MNVGTQEKHVVDFQGHGQTHLFRCRNPTGAQTVQMLDVHHIETVFEEKALERDVELRSRGRQKRVGLGVLWRTNIEFDHPDPLDLTTFQIMRGPGPVFDRM